MVKTPMKVHFLEQLISRWPQYVFILLYAVNSCILTLPYLRGGLMPNATPSADATVVGSVCIPEVLEG